MRNSHVTVYRGSMGIIDRVVVSNGDNDKAELYVSGVNLDLKWGHHGAVTFTVPAPHVAFVESDE